VAAIGLAAALAVPAGASAWTAYVASYMTNRVFPIDTATNAVGQFIPAGLLPNGLAIAPNGKTAYIADSGADIVMVINTVRGAQNGAIPVGSGPVAVAVAPDGKTGYVVNAGSNSVTTFDPATNTARASITVGPGPVAIAVAPDGETAYVVNHGSNDVTPIDTATGTTGQPIPVGSLPSGIAITPDGRTAYVTNEGADSVTPIDLATRGAGPAIPVGRSPEQIAIAPDGQTAYVTNGGTNTVTPFDTATHVPRAAITVGAGPWGIAITPDGKTAYIAGNGTGEVYPIDTATGTTGAPIKIGSTPLGVAVTPQQPPTAAFTASTVTVGQATRFDASDSTAKGSEIARYAWDFGNGDTGRSRRTSFGYEFPEPGTYTATLTVTDDTGCSAEPIFTGQTVFCNGTGSARVSHEVTVYASNAFTLGTVRLNRRRGLATIAVKVPGRGGISLTGPKVKPVGIKIRTKRRTRLTVTPLRSAKRKLERVGAARVRVRIIFAPKGGKPRTKMRTIKMVKR
jgi:YVTN family beta-propeller protein